MKMANGEVRSEVIANVMTSNIMRARDAIVRALGGPWKRGDVACDGRIDCPICGKPAALRYARSGINGRIWARCATRGCVGWIE